MNNNIRGIAFVVLLPWIAGLALAVVGVKEYKTLFSPGSAANHIQVASCSYINSSGMTVTIMGTPAFSTDFVNATDGGIARLQGNTFSGSATGARFLSDRNAVIDVGGATPNTYLPGNSNGTASNGGQCV